MSPIIANEGQQAVKQGRAWLTIWNVVGEMKSRDVPQIQERLPQILQIRSEFLILRLFTVSIINRVG